MADEERIRVIAPNGKRGTIPKSRLAEAQKMGFKLVEEESAPRLPVEVQMARSAVANSPIVNFAKELYGTTAEPILQTLATATGISPPATQLGQAVAKSPALPVGGAPGAALADIGQSFFQSLAQRQAKRVSKAAGGDFLSAIGAAPPVSIASDIAQMAFVEPVIEAGKRGGTAGAAGAGTGLLGMLALPELRRMRLATPSPAAETALRAIKPSKSVRLSVKNALPTALEEMRNTLNLNKINNMEDAASAARTARLKVGQEINQVISKGEGLTLDGNKLADSVVDSISKPTEVLEPEVAAKLRKSADNLRRPFSFAEAEELRQQLNAELGMFFRKGGKLQREAATNPIIVQKLALRDALGKEIDAALGKGGEQLAPLRKRYSAVRAVEDAINDRIITDLTKEYPGLLQFEALDRIAAGTGVYGLITGNLDLAAVSLGTVGIRRIMGIIERRLTSPDIRIRSAFRSAAKRAPSKLQTSAQQTALAAYLANDFEEESEQEKK